MRPSPCICSVPGAALAAFMPICTDSETEAQRGRDACPRPGEPLMMWGYRWGFGGTASLGSNPCFPTHLLYLLG